MSTSGGLVDRATLAGRLGDVVVEVVALDERDTRPLGGEPDRRADQTGADDPEPLDLHRPRLTASELGQQRTGGSHP